MALDLCERLRVTGLLQPIAPLLFGNGVRCVNDIMPNTSALLSAGVQAWQLEAVILGTLEVEVACWPLITTGRSCAAHGSAPLFRYALTMSSRGCKLESRGVPLVLQLLRGGRGPSDANLRHPGG